MATASALPETPTSRRTTALVVVGVNLLSTAAMLAYPLLTAALGFDGRQSGVFLGLSIHDVAQVAAAGASVSPEAAAAAALAKVSRILWLGPVVTLAALWAFRATARVGRKGAVRLGPPVFVWWFAALAVARSLNLMPTGVTAALASVSHILLLGGVAAISAQVSPRDLLRLEPRLGASLVLTTAFITFAGLFVALILAAAQRP